MTTLAPPPRSTSSARSPRREWTASFAWLAIAVVCFTALLLILMDRTRIERLRERSPRSKPAFHKPPPAAVPAHGEARIVPSEDHAPARESAPQNAKALPPNHAIDELASSLAPSRAQRPVITFAGPRGGAPEVKITRITPSLVTSPRYELAGNPGKPFKPGTWLEMEVKFDLGADLTNELTFRFTVDLERTIYVGEVVHRRLLAGRGLLTAAYLRPRALAPFLRNDQLLTGLPDHLRVEAFSGGKRIDAATLRPGDRNTPTGSDGFIVDLAATPFAPLRADYEPVAR